MKVFKRVGVLLLTFALLISCFESVSAALPDISSGAAVLIDAQTGQVLFEKNKDEKLYPASITKIMTLYLAAQSDNSELARASEEAIKAVPRDTSNIAIDYGEEFSLQQLMYAAQLMSANDACNVIAEHVSGSMDEFVKLMNKTARQMGTRNTNFANANGLMDKNHYTSAIDFALITQNAVKNKEFLKVFSEVEYSIPYTNKKDEMRNMVAQHRMMHWQKYEGLGVIGGKAGYTKESKHTLVTYAKKNGISVIAVVLNSPDFNAVYSDTEKLLEYAYNSLEKVTISGNEIQPETQKYKTFIPKGKVTFWFDKDESKEFTYAFSEEKVDVVSNSGLVMGSLDVDVKVRTPWWKMILQILGWIIGIFVAWLIFMYIVLIIRYSKKKRRRKAINKRYR